MKYIGFYIKSLLFIASFGNFSLNLLGQPKKPTIIILPSDNWCEQRYFMTEYDNQGLKQKVPNYKRAFQEDTELSQVISKIGALMIERGYPLKDAEQELKAIEIRIAEDNMTLSSNNGGSLSENQLDKLKNKVKADIIIQIWWKINRDGNDKSLSFILEAFDSYTSKRIASSTGNKSSKIAESNPSLLQNAVLEHIEPFVNQLQIHFEDMIKNGREVLLTVKKWDKWDLNLESEINGKEIIEYVNEWLQKNTVNGRFNMTDASENIIRCDQVRIPLYDASDNALDARQFSKGLQKYFKSPPFNYEVKLMTRGLGEAIIVLGDK